MAKEKEIILRIATLRTTLTHSAVTLLMFGALFAPSIWFDSSAMQWAAAALWLLWVIGFAVSATNKSRVTISEARKRLDELEAGNAGPP